MAIVTTNFKLDKDDYATDQQGQALIPDQRETKADITNEKVELIGIDKTNQMPWFKTDLKLPTSTNQDDTPDKKHTFDVRALFPRIILDYRTRGKPPLLLWHELEYFMNNPTRNATIFIHGFNVGKGKYDRHIKEIYTSEVPGVYHNEYATMDSLLATTYRNDDLIDSYIPGFKQKNLNLELNGTEDHNWFLMMEDNLNRATGQFTRGKDYSKYTRLINIQWHGDPDSAADYMEAVTNAQKAGQKLFVLIKQLIDCNIKINIIAHSLGNAVLLFLLDAIGKKYSEKIDHVFMWEPAVPNNVFSNKEGFWSFPDAAKATKKITVLYSQNDNVLGPIPKNQSIQLEVNKAKPIEELIPALALGFLGLDSVYELAMWLDVPLSYPFRQSNQNILYRKLRQEYKRDDLDATLWFQERKDKEHPPASMINFESKLQQLPDYLDSQLKLAGYPELAELTEILKSKFADDILLFFVATCYLGTNQTRLKEALESLNVIINHFPHAFIPALGYTGYVMDDTTKQLEKSGKLHYTNQTPWLWAHSAMKDPSKAVMENVYKKVIMGDKGMEHFGQYK